MKKFIFIDVSGSMPHSIKADVINMFKNEKDFKFFIFDTDIAEINEANNWNADGAQVWAGGTDFDNIIDIVNAESPDQVFVITDGYGKVTKITNEPKKWTWFMCGENFTRWIDPQCNFQLYENLINFVGNPL